MQIQQIHIHENSICALFKFVVHTTLVLIRPIGTVLCEVTAFVQRNGVTISTHEEIGGSHTIAYEKGLDIIMLDRNIKHNICKHYMNSYNNANSKVTSTPFEVIELIYIGLICAYKIRIARVCN